MPSVESPTGIGGGVDNPALDAFIWRIDSPLPRVTDSHVHAKGQLFSLESGLAVVESTVGRWMLLPHSCGWIPPAHAHSLRSCGGITGWSIYLAPALCNALPSKPAVLSLSPLLQQVVLRIAEWERESPVTATKEHLLAVLCDEIQSAKEQPLHLPLPTDPRLKKLVEAISQQPDEERTLDEWARWIGMSKRSLMRDFQAETGMTIGQWRHQLRMLVAIEKLSSGVSVTETCFAIGYNTLSAFIAAFKRVTGVTPLEYSRSQR